MALSTNTIARVALVHSLKQRVKARGERGLKGRDADPREIERQVTLKVAQIPPARDGKDVDPATVAKLVREAARAEVAKIPKPKDADMDAVMLRVGEFLRGVEPEKGDKGDDGEDGVDGVGIANIEFTGNFIKITLTDGRTFEHRFRALGRSGQPPILSEATGGAVATVLQVRTTSTDTALTSDDDILLVVGALPVTVTLPQATSRARPYHVKRVGLGEVAVQGVETIDGDPMKIINTRYTSLMLASTGTEWVIL